MRFVRFGRILVFLLGFFSGAGLSEEEGTGSPQILNVNPPVGTPERIPETEPAEKKSAESGSFDPDSPTGSQGYQEIFGNRPPPWIKKKRKQKKRLSPSFETYSAFVGNFNTKVVDLRLGRKWYRVPRDYFPEGTQFRTGSSIKVRVDPEVMTRYRLKKTSSASP